MHNQLNDVQVLRCSLQIYCLIFGIEDFNRQLNLLFYELYLLQWRLEWKIFVELSGPCYIYGLWSTTPRILILHWGRNPIRLVMNLLLWESHEVVILNPQKILQIMSPSWFPVDRSVTTLWANFCLIFVIMIKVLAWHPCS